jgi:hypothetical protein
MYYVGIRSGADITTAVVGGTYVIGNIAVGASQMIRLEVTVGQATAVWAMKSWL